MQDGLVCFESRNLGCHIVDGPESHGSIRMVKLPGGCWYELSIMGGRGVSIGEKVRRKVVSPLRCLTANDMVNSDGERCAQEMRFAEDGIRTVILTLILIGKRGSIDFAAMKVILSLLR